MSLLKNLTTDDSIANEKDSIGGSRVLESAVYDFKVEHAYVIKSDNGAMGLVLNLKTDEAQELRQTLWMTNKKGENFFTDKQGNKQYLPGFNHANALALLSIGRPIAELDTEEKVIKAWSKEAKAEIPTKVNMLMDLVGQPITAGVLKQTVNKQTKVGDAYVDSDETRDENEIDKLFRTRDKMTTAEIRAEATEAAFYNSWKEKNTGKTRDRTKKTTGTAGAPAAAASTATKKPTASLFG